jgi:hypothetical protein
VAVRVHVHRDPVDAGREIRAVVEIEAAQEILVRLAVARVLGHDESGHGLQQFARAHDRSRLELRARDGALAGRLHLADQRVFDGGHDDFVEIVRGNARGPRG